MTRTFGRGAAQVAGLAGASAVLCGAFGAHALRTRLDLAHAALWHTAVEYHFWHALALTLTVGLLRGRTRCRASGLFAVGIILFSGSLYALALGAPRWVGAITPLGGLAFIAGWLVLGWGLAARQNPSV